MKKLANVLERLEEMFKKANSQFYNGELELPIITVSPDGGSKALGWCTSWKAWTDGESGRYEINITSEYLNRDFFQIGATMLHEMVHLYHLQNGIQGVSRGGSYHNKKFKTDGEQRGLIIEKDDKYGWTMTTLNEDGKKFLESLDTSTFEIFRIKEVKMASGKKSSSRKYVCPECGQSIRATKEVNLICGDCEVRLEEV